MKFIIESQILSKSVQNASRIVLPNNSRPILDNFLFEISPNQLVISASDDHSFLTTTITQIESKETGSLAIPAKNLTDLLKTFANQPLTFTVEEKHGSPHKVNITSEQGAYELPCSSGENFSELGDDQWTTTFSTNALELGKAIDKAVFATSNTVERTAFSGVLFEDEEGQLNLVASDIQRLIRQSVAYIQSPNSPVRSIISKKPLTLISASLAELDSEATVELSFNENSAYFKAENIEMFTRLMNEEFPVYQNAVPTQTPFSLIIEADQMISSLRRLSIFASKNNSLVSFTLKGSNLNIVAEDIDFSKKAEENISCNYTGEDFTINFNAKYLADLVQHINQDEIQFLFAAPNKPVILKEYQENEDSKDFMMLTPLMRT